jgi:hypothetical protein
MRFDTSFPLSLSQFGPSNIHGVSNYFLPIFDGTSEAYILWFLDSGGGSYDEIVFPGQ